MPIFAEAPAAANARNILSRLVGDGDARWLAGTVIPDHIHCLFELGARLSFAESLAKVKGLISRKLSSGASVWQKNAFEHRLRASKHPRSKLRGTGPKGNEDAEGYAFYIFMNPYRAGLMTVTESWPGWIRSDAKRFRFLDALDENGAPPAEWLNRDETAGGTIVTGE